MRITVIAAGNKMPSWINEGVAEYEKRMPKEWNFSIRELPLEHRGKTTNKIKTIEKEK